MAGFFYFLRVPRAFDFLISDFYPSVSLCLCVSVVIVSPRETRNPKRETPMIPRHPKRRGEWVELQFMARAAAHGLTVSKPWGDSARYDFIVEQRGRFRRVQVKSTLQTAQ